MLRMSFQSKGELPAQAAGHYQEASHARNTQILDELVAAIGHTRKYAF